MQKIGLWSDDGGLCPRVRRAMRKTPPPEIENYRIWAGKYGSKPGDMHGTFEIKGDDGMTMVIMSSGSDRHFGWEHVSVSLENRAPTWDEMCLVKNLFWDATECVVQYHPSQADYVNHHPYCLHLWKPLRRPLPRPPTVLIGPRPPEESAALGTP